jgi:predicted MFS family arabinose efflux permease
MSQLTEQIRMRLSGLGRQLRPKQEPQISQRNLILANISSGSIGNLIGGNFFTGLLLLLHAGDALIGLVSMIGFVGNMLQVLSPLLLERFQSRKRFLIGVRIVLYVLNIVVIGLIPFLPVSEGLRLGLIMCVLLLLNVINALTASGFSVWHIKSVPESDRAGYFTINSIVNGIVVHSVILGAGAVVDRFKAAGNEMTGLVLFRAIALALCLLDVYMLAHIKEYPNERSASGFRLVDLLVRPFSDKKYMISVMTACLWSFTANIPGPYFTVYMLKDMGVSYSFLNAVNMLNIPILLFIAPLWRKRVHRISWFGTLTLSVSLFLVHYFVLAFTTKQTLFLFPLAVAYALVMAPGINLVFANMAFINLPEKDQTSFISFYAAMNNVAAFLGILAGQQFIAWTGSARLNLFGMEMVNKQYILLLTGTLMIGVVVAIQRLHVKSERMNAAEKTPSS